MNFLYSLYDALVSIHVPNDKARAVVDAMEHDMGTTLATKTDLQSLTVATKADVQQLRLEFQQLRIEVTAEIQGVRAELKAEIQGVRAELKAEIEGVRAELKAEIQELRMEFQQLSVRLDAGFEAARKERQILESRMTIRLSIMMAASIGIFLALQKLL